MRVFVASCLLLSCLASGQLLRPEIMPVLGQDGHDQQPHGEPVLGQDGHDQQHHGQPLLGQDGHDHQHHGQKLLGQDGHDHHHHGQRVLGQDGHDQQRHGQHLLGQDGHDQKHHGKRILGGDNHDRRQHTKHLLGGDDHDRHQHPKHLLGQGDHDYKKHGKKQLLGMEGHELTEEGMFNAFLAHNNKSYSGMEEYHHRMAIFTQNMKKVHVLQRNERGTGTYGASKFADLTEGEFRQLLGFRPHLKPEESMMQRVEVSDNGPIPKSFDWRDHGVVTPIKNQGMCGSCWAFSTTGNVEGQWAIKHKKLISLSEQELVDCDSEDQGCNGGLPENAYDAIAKLGGLETEQDYPYDGHDEQCHFNRSLAAVTVNGSVELPQDERLLAKWLVANGPISIGINANALQFYMGGVSHPLKFLCNPADLDHGMLIVGYGVHTYPVFKKTLPFWIVKNSWGEDWGEQGYYRVYRGDGTCGVNTMATSAIVP